MAAAHACNSVIKGEAVSRSRKLIEKNLMCYPNETILVPLDVDYGAQWREQDVPLGSGVRNDVASRPVKLRLISCRLSF